MGAFDIISEEAARQRLIFLRKIFAGSNGLLAIAAKEQEQNKPRFLERFYAIPNQLAESSEFIERYIPSHDIYYCPQLFSAEGRRKENVKEVTCLWADLDACPPERLLVKPTITIESSPGRYQALWLLDDSIDPFEAEELSKRIAYRHRDDGADISGWDLTQLLRLPLTFNHKYKDRPVVKVIDVHDARYRAGDFAIYPLLAGQLEISSDLPQELRTGEEILEEYRSVLPDAVWRLFSSEPEYKRWSHDLWQLEVLLAEAGLKPEEIFAVAYDAACNKYARDGRPQEALWKEVQKACAQANRAVDQVRRRSNQLSDLSGEQHSDTLVEHYIEWATEQTDAAEIYHQAGAFMVLSAALSGMVRLPTSYNPQGMPLNLWFLILGDTTITRKSTAMDMATDLLAEVSADAVVATDATIEGLMTTMAARPGKPSIFLRDEFSGLLAQMAKKEYYAGMAEMLTKLYDGRGMQRQLARSTVNINNPILILFTGGIRSRVLELMHEDYIRSGFLPRFLFFSAVSDVSKLKPLGPPTDSSDTSRDDLVKELTEIVKRYDKMDYMTIGTTTIPQRRIHYAQLTDNAWKRYNEAEHIMLQDGLNSKQPDLFTPVYQRLAISILKAATLLACTRPANPVDSAVEVTETDIAQALWYGQQWRVSALEVVTSSGADALETRLTRVYDYIAKTPNGASQAILMRMFKINAKDKDIVFRTLEQRGLIRGIKQGADVTYLTVGV